MKEDHVYPYYIIYLENRLICGEIGRGAYKLLIISASAFDDYKYRFTEDELFYQKQIELYKSESRDRKIDDIFDDID